ncbi:hypothetical protein ACMYZ5_10875 [Bacteroides sp. KG68]
MTCTYQYSGIVINQYTAITDCFIQNLRNKKLIVGFIFKIVVCT